MRQAGIIAAAGLEAVVNNYVRLSEVRYGSVHRHFFVASCALVCADDGTCTTRCLVCDLENVVSVNTY